jgi:hypothetical protein
MSVVVDHAGILRRYVGEINDSAHAVWMDDFRKLIVYLVILRVLLVHLVD